MDNRHLVALLFVSIAASKPKTEIKQEPSNVQLTNIIIILVIVAVLVLIAIVTIIIYWQCNKVKINIIGEYDEIASCNSLEQAHTGRQLMSPTDAQISTKGDIETGLSDKHKELLKANEEKKLFGKDPIFNNVLLQLALLPPNTRGKLLIETVIA